MKKNPTKIGCKNSVFNLLRKTFLVSVFCCAIATVAQAQADLYMRDTPLDVGLEPNPNGGAMYVSDDIWIRPVADPNYSPLPFVTNSPTWTPLPHENPEYRPTKFSTPNWVYVRVSNRGNAASSSTARLRVYWAKASTGLGWPSQWEDYFDTHSGCTGQLFMGEEITKTRKNVALNTPEMASERTRLKNAILELDKRMYNDGVSWWDKQDKIHESTHVHNGPAFLTWHRELVNRYENLLREIDPTIKLHYWDWTTDPRTANSVNLFTNGFMGISNGGVTDPFPSDFSTDGQIIRNLNSGAPRVNADITIVNGSSIFPDFSTFLENDHGTAHVYFGAGSTIRDGHRAFEDPFVFQLHSDVDKIFAQWQRVVGEEWRLDPNEVYGSETSSAEITEEMEPWSGTSGLDPWTSTGGEATSKNSLDPSVVSPPFYDSAPLTIPVLQPGESVIIQVPWYPANPADFACFGGDKGHFCLLARIEETTTAPFGMTFAEQSSNNEVTSTIPNVRNNNNIIWKNITVVDLKPNGQKIKKGTGCVIVRNVADRVSNVKLDIGVPQNELVNSFFNIGKVQLELPQTLYNKWVTAGMAGVGVQAMGNGVIAILSPNAYINNIALAPNQIENVCLTATTILPDKLIASNAYNIDLTQSDGDNVIGGERFTFRIPAAATSAKASIAEEEKALILSDESQTIACYPNPFQESTTIEFYLAKDANAVILKVYNILGEEVRSINVKTTKGKGSTKVESKGLESGIYFYSLIIDGKSTEKQKMILIK